MKGIYTMQLTIINASPRKKGSNTSKVLKPFIDGFLSIDGNSVKTLYCSEIDNDADGKAIFSESEAILLAFPLYSYGLTPPASRWVKRIESFVGKANKTKLGFLCQYGFREACHARVLERQLKKMCETLSVEYLGMLIRGGCEGIKYRPDRFNKKLFSEFNKIGIRFGELKKFDEEQLLTFSAPEKANSGGAITLLASKIGIWAANKTFWRAKLKENDAIDKHWDQPLLEA